MKKLTLVCILGSTLFVGCSSGPSKQSMLPDSGPTTKQVYDDHMAGKYQDPTWSTENGQETALSGRGISINVEIEDPYIQGSDKYIQPQYSTASRNTNLQLQNITQDFRRIDNPEIVGYVYPHLSPNEHPVPGYFTMFPLYPAAGYALSNEEGIVR